MTDDCPESRQERRENKRLAARNTMVKHGKGLARVYKDAALKRLDKKRPDGKV